LPTSAEAAERRLVNGGARASCGSHCMRKPVGKAKTNRCVRSVIEFILANWTWRLQKALRTFSGGLPGEFMVKNTRRSFLHSLACRLVIKGLAIDPSVFTAERLFSTPHELPKRAVRARWADSQERENSFLWDWDRWVPEVVNLKPNEITHVIGYNGLLSGSLKLSPGSPGAVEPRSVPYGFVSQGDILHWKVMAPKDDEYRVAIVYHNGRKINVGSIMEVSAGGQHLTAGVRAPTQAAWKDGPPGRPAFRRDWLPGTIILRTGINVIELRLSQVTPIQAALARMDLRYPLDTWPKRSLHVVSIELARPEVLRRLQEQAHRLHASSEWLVEGKYGLFVSWAPECYPLYGNVQAYRHYQDAVTRFDVEVFSDVVLQMGASWVIFTTTHGKYYFPGPSETMDRVLPGRTCNRDLIRELAEALSRRKIRLMLYFHPGPSAREDRAWAQAAGISPVNDALYNRIMMDIFTEAGERYGRSLAGWFIDGGYAYYVRNTSFERLTKALKAGNHQRLISYYVWIFPEWFPFAGDFLEGVLYSGGPLSPPMPCEWFAEGGPYVGLQPHFAFNLEGIWNPSGPLNGKWPAPVYPKQAVVRYFEHMARQRWPLTVNMVITEDVNGKRPFFNPRSMEIMEAVRAAVKGG